MPKKVITKFLVQMLMPNEFDTEILKRRIFNVNIRLLVDNKQYRKIISYIIYYMNNLMETKFSDYTTLKGLSGANLGIPFNIIAVRDNGSIKILINPRITKKSTRTKIINSNCGSIRLSKPIPVRRSIWINVEWYDIKGTRYVSKFEGPVGNTIQHEIDHNLGVLITNRSNTETRHA